ncbi:UNVERIFIED_CONTAM: hypothetical protein K2H54_043629 [Gekko kuhli]
MLVPYLPTLSSNPSPLLPLFLLSSAKDSTPVPPTFHLCEHRGAEQHRQRNVQLATHGCSTVSTSKITGRISVDLPPSPYPCQGQVSAGRLSASSILFQVS